MRSNKNIAKKKQLLGLLLLFIPLFSVGLAEGDTTVVFGTQWFAEAQQGGFYEALANGVYKKYGLNVIIKMGGPNINGQQLLSAGQYQFYQGRGINQLVALDHKLPLVTVAAFFQKSPDCIYAHDDIRNPYQLANEKYKILVAPDDMQSWWPWAIRKFGYKASQAGVYTGSIIPFLANKNIAQQGYYGAEDFMIMKSGEKFRTFLLTDYGYPEYSGTIQTTDNMVRHHPGIVKRFVEASLIGWKEYLQNPAPGNFLIRKANPKQTSDQLAYSMKTIVDGQLLEDAKAKSVGIGIMTARRWKRIFKMAVHNGLVNKHLLWRKAFTLTFINRIHVYLKSK
ncbi:ABC transporter substrate-binding protein [Acidithiobacillus sp.]|uniref:ABC transporter substrate-binding protein n=1 Tax=Acidithiobacillus sp. TaxID=1872118 RepID=UPI0032B01235